MGQSGQSNMCTLRDKIEKKVVKCGYFLPWISCTYILVYESEVWPPKILTPSRIFFRVSIRSLNFCQNRQNSCKILTGWTELLRYCLVLVFSGLVVLLLCLITSFEISCITAKILPIYGVAEGYNWNFSKRDEMDLILTLITHYSALTCHLMIF